MSVWILGADVCVGKGVKIRGCHWGPQNTPIPPV